MRLIIATMISLGLISNAYADTCWNRDYTVQHLAKQPHQTVTNIGFRMGKTHNGQADFNLFIKRRGSDDVFQAFGKCREQRIMFGDMMVMCEIYSEEGNTDRGHFTLSSSEKQRSILIHIAEDMNGSGFIELYTRQGETIWFDAGKSDTSFRLDLAKCR